MIIVTNYKSKETRAKRGETLAQKVEEFRLDLSRLAPDPMFLWNRAQEGIVGVTWCEERPYKQRSSFCAWRQWGPGGGTLAAAAHWWSRYCDLCLRLPFPSTALTWSAAPPGEKCIPQEEKQILLLLSQRFWATWFYWGVVFKMEYLIWKPNVCLSVMSYVKLCWKIIMSRIFLICWILVFNTWHF